MKKIKFIKNPFVFLLAYSLGDVVEIETKQAVELIEAGYAVEAEPAEIIETATEKTAIKKAVKK
jgi:hypothetical protein